MSWRDGYELVVMVMVKVWVESGLSVILLLPCGNLVEETWRRRNESSVAEVDLLAVVVFFFH